MGSKLECAKLHSTEVLDESVIVNPNGTLKNVFVWVKRGLQGYEFPTPTEPVVLNQKGCMFHPRVVGVQVGQPVLIRNGDPLMHNVHSIARFNGEFNFSQPVQGREDMREFRYPEIMVRIKCDVHGWMASHVGVVRHPYFATTRDDGSFQLAKLPPGNYVVAAWHEEFGEKSAEVSLSDGETKDLEYSF
jgi:hypothetical protein